MRKLIFIVFILCLILGCYKNSDYEIGKGIAAEDILKLTADPITIPADGASTTRVKAHIPPEADPSKRAVTLETNAGIWIENGTKTITITANTDGDAMAELQSETVPKTARVRAGIANIIQEAEVTFERAFPESITVDPGCFGLKASLTETTTVKANLTRQTGKPSEGTIVNFSATNNNGDAIGNFRTITTSNKEGTATALFCVGNTKYRGVVIIKASTEAKDGVIEGTASIIVIK